MNKLLLYFFIGVVFFSCKKINSVEKTELKEIFSQLMSDEHLNRKYYLIDSIENFNTKSISESDTIYLIAKNEIVNKGIWTNYLYDSAKIISKTHLHSLAKTWGVTPPHYWFSLPYFSKDGNSFMIYYNYYCGSLCAESSLRLYKKINGKWEFIKTYYSIVS